MTSVLDKYYVSKSKETIKYINEIFCMFSYTQNITIDDVNKKVKEIVNTYYYRFYGLNNFKFENINKYYNLDDKTDILYKLSLESTLLYYIRKKLDISKYSEEIIYISYVLFFALVMDKLRLEILKSDNKVLTIISISNSISNNFKPIEKEKFKKHVKNVISLIRENVRKDKRVYAELLKDKTDNFDIEYELISEDDVIYKLNYEEHIKDLEKYKPKDVKKIFISDEIDNEFKLLSYQFSQVSLLRCLFDNIRINVAFEIDETFYKKKGNISNLFSLVTSNYTSKYTKLIINANEYKDCQNIRDIKNSGIDIIINCDNYEDIKDIDFDEHMILYTTLEIINENKSLLNNIKYIKKGTKRVFKTKDIFVNKIELEDSYE